MADEAAVDVRWATTQDAEALATVLCAMAVHYRQAPLDHSRAAATARQWLSEESPAYPHFALRWPASPRWPSRTPASISKG